MTQELFREDAYRKSCTASIDLVTEDGGVVLNQTVFYPEGGGQPGDRGELETGSGEIIRIIDTRKDSSGTIVHYPEANDLELRRGTQLEASIDWPYRYRHMRTHSCLHLLCSLIPYPVTGGSISQDKGRLDFDMSETVDKAALQASLEALVKADHPISFRWISDDEMAANMDLVRTMSVRPPMGQGRVRLIDVAGVDLQPCGGTHVARSSEIGAVRIGKVEKKGKQNRRINIHLD